MQEICIDILLPEGLQITNIEFKRQVLQLDGQLYPQDLVQAQYGSFYLTPGPVPGFVLPLLPKDQQKQPGNVSLSFTRIMSWPMPLLS